SGITSPARRTTTVSPTRTSLRCTSSMLCSVTLLTVTPLTNTGASRATGVSAPVRPTWNSMSLTTVSASSGANLWAIAQRGARECPEAVEESREWPRGGNARVELPQAPGGRVARIHEHLLAALARLAVHALEAGERHEDLPARLEQGRSRRAQALRHGANGA